MRVAVGISDWPESMGERFDIEELIARAKSHYGPELEVVIEIRQISLS